MSQHHVSTMKKAGLAKIGLVRLNLSLINQHKCLCSVIPGAFGLWRA